MLSLARAFLVNYFRGRHQKFHSRSELEDYQAKHLYRLLKIVRKKSPFYRALWSGIGDADWRTFPMIDKRMMMDNFSTLNTAGIAKEEAFQVALRAEAERDFSPTIDGITIGLSSGTSGHRGLFLVSPEEQASWAGMVLGKLLPESLFFGSVQRIAFFLRANSNLYESVNRRKIQFAFYDLMLPMEQHATQLASQNPTMLIAPSSVLVMLARLKNEGRLPCNPKKIIAVAEVLEPLDRALIEESFGQIVHQVYQCTEGFLGATCQYGTLHLNESQVIFEREYVGDDHTRFVPIITDVRRLTQPIVRYRHTDILKVRAEACPCGSPQLAIEAIEGRCDDLFYMRAVDSDELRPVFPDFIRRAIMQVEGAIEEYQVVQTALDQLEIHLRADEAQHDAIRAQAEVELSKICADLRVQLPQVQIDFQYQAPERGVKVRRVLRTFAL
jgi:putative adenylate-forming enzyme